MAHGHKTGKEAEAYAAQWLKLKSVDILQRNFHCRYGEIDLIGLDNETLVFFEVRYRRHHRYGGAAASVTTTKQNKLIKTASLFLAKHIEHQYRTCRFDVIAYESPELNQPIWYKDAFRL